MDQINKTYEHIAGDMRKLQQLLQCDQTVTGGLHNVIINQQNQLLQNQIIIKGLQEQIQGNQATIRDNQVVINKQTSGISLLS